MENETLRKKTSRNMLIVVGGIFAIVVLGIIVGNSNSGGQSSAPTGSQDNSELKAGVIITSDGIAVTNEENADWTNCMVGLNGGSGWNFDNPPYQTRTNLTLPANKMTPVPFTKITTADGTIFDPTTHTISSMVVECFRGTGNLRDWIGTASQ
jgi:hypothetical protein